MGFFDLEEEQAKQQDPLLRGLSVELLHAKGCDMCPLNHNHKARSPHMEPSGSEHPVVYILGDQVTDAQDRKDIQDVGRDGQLILDNVPRAYQNKLRWNNVTRTRTPDGRRATQVEIECCRPSIVKDIERTKPVAIFGFGPEPLAWVMNETHPQRWTGRHIPVQIGKHKCWFFPFVGTADVLESRNWVKSWSSDVSDMEFTFQLHMRSAFNLLNKLPEPVIHTRETALANVSWVTGEKNGDLDRVEDYIARCHEQEVVGLDYETSVLRPYNPGTKILTAALATGEDAFAFPFDHSEAGWRPVERKELGRMWREFLESSTCEKVSHHLGFELEWSGVKFGVDTVLNGGWEDSESQAWLLDERQGMLSLDVLAHQYFGLPVKDLFVLDKKNMSSEPLSKMLPYNGVDAKYHRKLFFKQRTRLRAEGMLNVYDHMVARVRAATMTTMKGVPVNKKVVEDYFLDYTKQEKQLEREALEQPAARKFKNNTGQTLVISNTRDITKALIADGVKLEATKNKKRKNKAPVLDDEGNPNLSTNEQALMKSGHPLAAAVVKWRKVNKLLSTYVVPVRKGSPHLFADDCLHPIVNCTKARTPRTTSEDPNIQNWPKRGPAKVIRKQITVDDDHVIVAIDYAGIQARNVAMESKDKRLIQHYWDRYDIHSDWLERLQRIAGKKWRPLENIGDVTGDKLHKELRGSVKNKFVFPSFFGAVGRTVSGYLGIDQRLGEKLSDEFFSEFPGVHKWHEDLREFYREHGYVTGLSEFKRHAPIEINQLINAPIQADETIIVCGAWARLVEKGFEPIVPNWMVHDDLSFIWRKKDLDKHLDTVVPIMLKQVHAWERTVPMEIEVSTGKNWCDLKEIAKFETLKDGGYHEVKDDKQASDKSRWDYKIGKEGVPTLRQTGW